MTNRSKTGEIIYSIRLVILHFSINPIYANENTINHKTLSHYISRTPPYPLHYFPHHTTTQNYSTVRWYRLQFMWWRRARRLVRQVAIIYGPSEMFCRFAYYCAGAGCRQLELPSTVYI